MEQQPVVQPIWQIQTQIGEKVLEVNRILSLLEAGLMKIGPKEDERAALEDFVAKLLELEVIFYPELVADERYHDILVAIDLYRKDKRLMRNRFPLLSMLNMKELPRGHILKSCT